jgi:hypothetical protein
MATREDIDMAVDNESAANAHWMGSRTPVGQRHRSVRAPLVSRCDRWAPHQNRQPPTGAASRAGADPSFKTTLGYAVFGAEVANDVLQDWGVDESAWLVSVGR